jgi:DNA-directed RNA polymerase specialized sigma24 family protein
MFTVVRREALAVRRMRQRALEGGAATLEWLPCEDPTPQERIERRERVERAATLLRRLKPHERRAIALQAEGYSYAEIQAITGWTYTKVNRCLAEGRARLRELGSFLRSPSG